MLRRVFLVFVSLVVAAVGMISVPSAASAAFPSLVFSRLTSPALGLDAVIREDGEFGSVRGGEVVLPGPLEVTRLKSSASVGDRFGNIVVAGHINFNGVVGALSGLSGFPVGSRVVVSNSWGLSEEFELVSVKYFPKSVGLPVEIFTGGGQHGLVLVSCGGSLSRENGIWSYSDNVVAQFRLV